MNWIKIRVDLFEDADVMRLSDILETDDPTTVGLLVRFWAWADKQTTDGTDIAVSSARIDRLVGREGFAEGMRLIGWLSGRDGSLCLPRYDRHNGNSAKARALEAEAKRLRRGLKGQGAASDEVSGERPTSVGQNVGPEKRREEKSKKETTSPFAPDGTSSDPKPAKAPVIAWGPSGFEGIAESDMSAWTDAYPAVNLKSEIARAHEWLLANPTKRKKAVRRFLVNWLARSQERGGDRGAVHTAPAPPAPPNHHLGYRTGSMIRAADLPPASLEDISDDAIPF